MLPLQALVGTIVLAAAAWSLGETVRRRWLDLGRSASERAALAGTLGLALLAQLLFLMGWWGLLRPWPLWWMTAGVVAAGTPAWKGAAGALARSVRRPQWRWWLPILAALVPVVGLSLYPPTAFDAWTYHLPYVRGFLETGTMGFYPELRFPIFPQVAEVLFLHATVLGNDIAAQGTQVLALLVTVVWLVALGERLNSRIGGILAACFYLGSPHTIRYATVPYVDVLLALFLIAAAHAAVVWKQDRDDRWLVLVGGFAGMAAAIKYLGLIALVVFGGLVLLESARQSWRDRELRRHLRPALLCGIVALAALAPWYGRILQYTGNPVFPFYEQFFGASEWGTAHGSQLRRNDGKLDPSAENTLFSPRNLVDAAADLVVAPWRSWFQRAAVGHQPPLAPLALLLPLFVPWAWWRHRPLRPMLLVGIAYLLFWPTTNQDLRFLLPALVLLAPAVGCSLADLVDRVAAQYRGRLAAAMALVMLLPGPAYAVYAILGQGRLPLTAAGRESYNARQLRDYGALRWLNQHLGGDERVVGVRLAHLRYGLEPTLLGEVSGPYSFDRYERHLDSSVTVAQEMRRVGARYLVLTRRHRIERLEGDSEYAAIFRARERGPTYVIYELREELGAGPETASGSPSRGRF